MMSESYDIWKEEIEMENDNKRFEAELLSSRNRFAEALRGEMGKDMIEVINGRKTISIPLHRRISFKIKCFFNNIFERL